METTTRFYNATDRTVSDILDDMSDDAYELKYEKGEGAKQFPPRDSHAQQTQQTVRVSRKILIELLKNMDSDAVDIRVSNLYPLYIRGLIGDELASAGIAPIIEEMDYEQESEKTRD